MDLLQTQSRWKKLASNIYIYFFWIAFQLRNTMPFPSSASFLPHSVKVKPLCQPSIMCWQHLDCVDLDEQVNTNTCLGSWKASLLAPFSASRACVTKSLSREEEQQQQLGTWQLWGSLWAAIAALGFIRQYFFSLEIHFATKLQAQSRKHQS